VHLLGVAYKRDIDDVRESPALDIIHLLQRRGAAVSYTDPFVPVVRLDGTDMHAQDISVIEGADCVVIITDHAAFDYAHVIDNAKLIVDTRNALKKFSSEKIIRL
jgi:UDP-N-acetyl-D-glucosamine dehydrogenase